MKIPPDTIAYMESAMREHDKNRDLFAHAKAYEYAGLTPKRFRWDCLHGALGSRWICDSLYRTHDCNDDHIDSALRAIMRAIGIDWAATK